MNSFRAADYFPHKSSSLHHFEGAYSKDNETDQKNLI